MDKKIGNLFLIAMFSTVLCASREAKIDIELMNKNHQPIDKAEIGVPFILQVTCQNFDPKTGLHGLESTQDLVIQSAGTTRLMNYMNGTALKEEYIFNYLIQSKKKGILELGPITAQDKDGNSIHSKKIDIEIGNVSEAKYTGKESYILDVECKNEQVYVGQKLPLQVNFCYQAGFENLAIENSLPDDVEVGYQDTNWTSSKKIIESKEYPCKQMSIEIFPKKSGMLVIPSFKATFISDQQRDIGLFGFFGFANSKVIESQPKQITVLPLPESGFYKDVEAIGKFKSAIFTIDSKKGQVGEGIHAKMIVEGDGNLNILHHPQLILSEGIRFYEGNSSYERINETVSKKTFDWILQADYPGTFTIGKQNFIYFDPVDKKYKELHTNSVQLIIEGSMPQEQEITEKSLQDNFMQEEKKDEDNSKSDMNPEEKQAIKYYSAQKFYHAQTSSILTKWIILLVILMGLLFMTMLLMPYLKKIFLIETIQYRWLFWKYYKAADLTAIYALFEKIAHDYQFELQSEKLHKAFAKNKLSDESFENWKSFLHMLLEFNFASNRSLQDKQVVLDLAKQWFSIILLCCKALRKK